MHPSRMRRVRCSDRLGGVSASGEGSAQEGCLPGGTWGGCPERCLPRGCTPPPVNRVRDRCKNITFPKLLLRTVKIFFHTGMMYSSSRMSRLGATPTPSPPLPVQSTRYSPSLCQTCSGLPTKPTRINSWPT